MRLQAAYARITLVFASGIRLGLRYRALQILGQLSLPFNHLAHHVKNSTGVVGAERPREIWKKITPCFADFICRKHNKYTHPDRVKNRVSAGEYDNHLGRCQSIEETAPATHDANFRWSCSISGTPLHLNFTSGDATSIIDVARSIHRGAMVHAASSGQFDHPQAGARQSDLRTHGCRFRPCKI